MLLKVIRFFRGYVDFYASGKFPERFLNITAHRGINLWNALPAQNGLKGSMYAGDYKKIRSAARKSRVKLSVTARHGLPFIINRFKPRAGLAVGAAASIILLLIFSNFIWSVKITGTVDISDTYLYGVLAENGVSVGAYKNSIDVQSIERKIMLKVDKIGWMSINISGNLINVELKEKADKPEIDTGTKPCNIKAKCDGVITKIKASNGITAALKGSGVAKGDLLVSGISETALGTVRYVRAKAEVFADVAQKREITIPKKANYYSINENKYQKYRLNFLWLSFPCSLSFEHFEKCISSEHSQKLLLNNVVLPVGTDTLTTYEVTQQDVTIDKKTADKIIMTDSLLYEVFAKQNAKAVKREIKTTENGSEYSAKINYTFNENIAQSVEFEVTEQP